MRIRIDRIVRHGFVSLWLAFFVGSIAGRAADIELGPRIASTNGVVTVEYRSGNTSLSPRGYGVACERRAPGLRTCSRIGSDVGAPASLAWAKQSRSTSGTHLAAVRKICRASWPLGMRTPLSPI